MLEMVRGAVRRFAPLNAIIIIFVFFLCVPREFQFGKSGKVLCSFSAGPQKLPVGSQQQAFQNSEGRVELKDTVGD